VDARVHLDRSRHGGQLARQLAAGAALKAVAGLAGELRRQAGAEAVGLGGDFTQ
jgi:hypothetical protein